MKINRIIVLVIVFSFSVIQGFADGGGGMFFGVQTTQYPFLKDYYIRNNSLGLSYYGGFGYGIHRHTITGGFGYAIMDTSDDTGLSGGFGGVIRGFRILKWPVNLSLISWTGFGGVYTGTYETQEGKGFFCVSEELDLELGIPLFSWFMPIVYAGYQVSANIVPGKIFKTFISYSPVIGFRVAWGDFN